MLQENKPSYEQLERQLFSARKRISDLEMSIKMSGDRERVRKMHLRMITAEGTVESVEAVLRMWVMTPGYTTGSNWGLLALLRDAMKNWRATETARLDSSTGPAP